MNRPHDTITRRVFPVLVCLYLGYATAYIASTSFVVNGERYFMLLDDAMISMRYAKNVVDGHGLVFNPGGEPVEGYSNPLWVLIMALVHLLPVATSKISVVVQIIGAGLGLLNIILVKKLADYLFNSSAVVTLAAACLTAFYLPLNAWNMQGMEISLLTCVVTGATLRAVQCTREARPTWWLFILLGLATLVRMDMVIPAVLIIAYLSAASPEHRWRHLVTGLLVTGAFLAAQTGFRLLYYGDFLPNTYYLKLTGYPLTLRIARGLEVAVSFVKNMYVLPFFAPLVVLLFHRSREFLLLGALFLAQIGYSIWVGGDVWDWWGGSNRFISIVMPFLFVIYGYAVELVVRRSILRGHVATPATVMVLLGLVAFNCLQGPSSLQELLLLEPPLHHADNVNMVKRAELVKQITKPEATIAVTWAGGIPYFADRYTVDLLGKNDPHIARLTANRRPDGSFPEFLPGHMKRDYAYSLGKLLPDVIVQLWGKATEAETEINAYYQPTRFGQFIFALRNDSEALLADEISAAANK